MNAKKITLIVVAILLVVLIVGLCLFFFVGAGKKYIEDLKYAVNGKYAVEYNDHYYTPGDGNMITLPYGGEAVFRIVNAPDTVSVKIVPNVELHYTVNGEEKVLTDIPDLTSYFIAEDDIIENGVRINCERGRFNPTNLLKRIYGEDAVIALGGSIATQYLYRIVFTSGDAEVAIQFYQESTEVYGIYVTSNGGFVF